MGNSDVRTDKAARELFDLIKTNFRKLQRYLRTERPDQYELMKMRRVMEESVDALKKKYSQEEELRLDLIAHRVFNKDYSKLSDTEKQTVLKDKHKVGVKESAEKGAVLEDATDKMIQKFPTLKAALIKLQTEDFKEFVESIDWISPRPTAFKVNLTNGQDYILKWLGEGFEAQILGKRYYINKISEYQQALDKLSVLYKEGPMGSPEEPAEPADTDSGSSGGGGGDFPGEDGGASGGDAGDLPADLGGEETGEEGGGADLTDEPVDFEEPAEEPEA